MTLVSCYFRIEEHTKIPKCDLVAFFRGLQTGHLYNWVRAAGSVPLWMGVGGLLFQS